MASKHSCPECNRSFKSKYAMWGHLKAHGGRQKPPSAPIAEVAEPIQREPPEASTTGISTSFYPPLASWEAEVKTEAEAEREGEIGQNGEAGLASETTAPSPATTPASFDTSGIWRAAGDFIDETILKDKQTKIAMTDAKAKLLNDSLMGMGFMVEAPAEPIVIGYWMPFAITVFSVFVLPILLSVAPDFISRIPGLTPKEKSIEEK